MSKSNVALVSSSPVASSPVLSTSDLQGIADTVAAAPAPERAVKADPKKLATIRETVAHVMRSVRIKDKSPEGVAYKVAQALNKAGVQSERTGEPVWTRASALAEVAALHKAGLLK
jgi:hypothetical protein